jgi:signal transduction histidine kinase
VRVSAELSNDGGVVINVTDTGIGMSRGEVQLALEPYGQVDGPMQRERKGTGLGLPVAKALAEANKAIFRIESEPQRGTRVQVLFPPTRVLAG